MESRLIALMGKLPDDRLASLKALAARFPHYGDHRQIYRQGFHPLTMRQYPMNASDPERAAGRFYESAEQAGLRFVGWADESLRLRHTGWFADNYNEETFRGAIFRLPALRQSKGGGQERFIAGYGERMNDGFVLALCEVWNDDLIGAAREAERLAERAAEVAREYEAKESAKMRIDEIADELKNIRSEILDLCRSIREACPGIGQYQPIRSALRANLEGHLHNRQQLVNERERLQEDYWSIVPA